MRSRCPEMAIRAGLIVLMTATTILAVAAAGPAKGVRAVIDATSYVNRELADCGLQKAIDEAHAKKGGVVKLPEGTFLLRRGLVLKDGVELVGAGMDKTVLMPARQVLRLNVVKDGPQFDGGYHYRGRADVFYDMGRAFGQAMVPLAQAKATDMSAAVAKARKQAWARYGFGK